ncbi:hypothetical protein K3495_g16257, partial [Podosphaera aphanis]
ASSDHIPICTEMLIQPEIQEEQATRHQWKKADWEVVNRILAAKIRGLERERLSLNSRETIDKRVISITEIIQATIEETIPRARPSSFAKPYWTSECSKAVKDTRKARRNWKMLGTEDSWIEYLTSTSVKKAQIRKAKNIGWRATVSEAAEDPTKIWKLAKWARKDPEERHRLPQVPDIKGADGTFYTEAQDKIDIMAHHFFPQPVAADTRDIEGSTYPEDLPNISDMVTQNEIKEILQKLPSDKAPGPDGIPNRFLKGCEPSLSKVLAELFNACLTLGYHPKGFKQSTTIVLRKPQKPRYDIPKSYRPIALLNT